MKSNHEVNSMPEGCKIFKDVLFVPLKVNLSELGCIDGGEFNYYVSVSKDTVRLANEFEVDLSILELESLDGIEILKKEQSSTQSDGWCLLIKDKNSFIDINMLNEGVSCTLYINDESSDENYCYFSEMIDVESKDFDKFKDKALHCVEVAHLFRHKSIDEMNTVLSIFNVDIKINGTCILSTEDDDVDLIEYTENFSKERLKKFIKFTDGKNVDDFDEVNLNSSSYFTLDDEDGEMLSESITNIPEKLSEKALFIAMSLAGAI